MPPTVAYYYDQEIGTFNYGGGNPMRPHRVRLTHSLVSNYDLEKSMVLHRPKPRSELQIEEFHADDYVKFLKAVTPDNQDEFLTQMRRFNLGSVGEADCPVFDGMFEYCSLYSGGSVGGAALLNQKAADICLNWSGGMHHAKKAEASGFCYINDIVLAILELLKTHQRVLYVDIDIHHGDGVEEAFYLTDRVMTVSFHKYGDFFPGTGALGDIGTAAGNLYSVNVPLQEGMDDESYRFVFEPVMQKVMETFQPGAVVVCGGADSLSGDRLGCFNLSLQGHAGCMDFLARFGVPLLILGGGGYTMRNVARCWCYETGRLLGLELPDDLPEKALEEFDYYMDTHKLRIATSNMRNANTREALESIKRTVLANLSKLPAAPSVQIGEQAPGHELPEKGEEDPDVRGGGQAAEDARVAKPDEGYFGEEADRGARNVVDGGGGGEGGGGGGGEGGGGGGGATTTAAAAGAAGATTEGAAAAAAPTGAAAEGNGNVAGAAAAPAAPDAPKGPDEKYLGTIASGGGGGGGGGAAAAPAAPMEAEAAAPPAPAPEAAAAGAAPAAAPPAEGGPAPMDS